MVQISNNVCKYHDLSVTGEGNVKNAMEKRQFKVDKRMDTANYIHIKCNTDVAIGFSGLA